MPTSPCNKTPDCLIPGHMSNSLHLLAWKHGRYVQEECLRRFPHVCRPGGLGNLPTSAAQQPAGQGGRFTNFGGQMPQVSVIPACHPPFSASLSQFIYPAWLQT